MNANQIPARAAEIAIIFQEASAVLAKLDIQGEHVILPLTTASAIPVSMEQPARIKLIVTTATVHLVSLESTVN